MIVGILDDSEAFLDTGLLPLEQTGIEVRKFSEPESFSKWAITVVDPVVLFVDHDLGHDLVGYDVVRTIRHERSDGLIVPIVYLTGRETETGFLEAEGRDPYGTPSVYLNKRSLVKTDLPRFLESLAAAYGEAKALSESQSVRQAMSFFQHLGAEDIMERN